MTIPSAFSRRRFVATSVLGAVGAVSLAACSEPVPPAKLAETSYPAVTEPAVDDVTYERIMDDMTKILKQGEATLDPATLAPRVTGPALQALTAQYQLAKTDPAAANLPKFPNKTELRIPQSSDKWPRGFLAVTDRDETDSNDLLRMLAAQQPSAREPFKLSHFVRLLPGSKIPNVLPLTEGNPELGIDAESLRMKPVDVLVAYADVLTAGTNSAHAGVFVDDQFRTQIANTITALQENVQNTATQTNQSAQDIATVTQAFAAPGTDIYVLQTADKGALVMGTTTSVLSMVLGQASTSAESSTQVAALTGKPEFTKNFTLNSMQMLLFNVPSNADPSAQISLLGAYDTAVSATVDVDAAAPAPEAAPSQPEPSQPAA